MVFQTCVLCCSSLAKNTPKRSRRQFLDTLRIYVKGGSGGMGMPKYGGVGGNGGNIFAVGKEGVTLKDVVAKNVTKRITAMSGENAHSKCIVGSRGADIIINAPLGITIFSESGKKLGEIDKEGEKVLIARGGIGGCKDNGFCGLKGDSGSVTFDLKLIADVGLVGFPNAGKSTLLSAISNATPRIAPYPFTTLHPQLGSILYPDQRTITVADLPGLIEGAHVNVGLGHRFLKHIERTSLLALVVDVGGFRLNRKYKSRSCLETIILLNKELELYREELLSIPSMLIINKLDKERGPEIFKEVEPIVQDLQVVFEEVPEKFRPYQALNFKKIIGISARNKSNEELDNVKYAMREILDADIEAETAKKEIELIKKMDVKLKEYGPNMI
ncbi:GTP-binding protein 10 homolog [Halyomorpha halys]|uniref:GTP-binding protein 10 homolog n=1 Tax=Halyomorpha halys TaxID=286706 RepID=UPI0006D51B3E|nr:GTP-binding protein 10 homolog [Halyomorpha halys]